MAIATGDRAPEFDLEEAYDQPRVRLRTFGARATSCSSSTRSAFTPSAPRRLSTCRRTSSRSGTPRPRSSSSRCDSSATRQAWRKELGATYTFASDFWQHGAAARAYGVFDEDTGAPVRGTFLIDKDGVVIWSLVKDGRRTEMVPELPRERSTAGA